MPDAPDPGRVLRRLRDMAADPALRDPARGGISQAQLADSFGVAPSTVGPRLRQLEGNGKARRVYGLHPETGKPRSSWLPAEHPDAPAESAPTRGRPSHNA